MNAGTEPISYSNQLPQAEEALYLISAEVMNDNHKVEDTLLSVVYIPKQELKASLSLDKPKYNRLDRPVLKITNQGSTVLLTGLPYRIQNYNGSVWENARYKVNFTLQGILINPNQTFEQKIRIDELESGTYRIIKDVQVLQIDDLKQTLITEFEVE